MRLIYDIRITEVTDNFSKKEITDILQGKVENKIALPDFVHNEIGIYDEDKDEFFPSVATIVWVPYFENK